MVLGSSSKAFMLHYPLKAGDDFDPVHDKGSLNYSIIELYYCHNSIFISIL